MDAPMDSPEHEHASPPPARLATAGARTGGSSAAGARSCSPSPSPSATAAFTSAKMLDAQRYFQRVVKQELQVLLAKGVQREDAVRMLLHRIVQSTEPPEPAAVRSVMRQFQMNYDDAVRALIVKQELGRLKRKGMDSLAAIEQLTRRMQRIPALNDASEAPAPPLSETLDVEQEEAVEATSSDESVRVEASADVASAEETKEEAIDKQPDDDKAGEIEAEASSDSQASEPEATDDIHEATVADTAAAAAAVARVDQGSQHGDEEEAEKDVEKQLNLSSLTLCQRIDKVSISSTATRVSQADQLYDAPTSEAGTRDSRAQSPRSATTNSNANTLTPPPASLRLGRKRRAPFGLDGRPNMSSSDGSMSPERHVSISSSLASMSHDLYPSVKKQKRCEVGDGLLSVLSRKTKKHQTPPASPAASDSDASAFRPPAGTSASSTSASDALSRSSSKNLVKRPRSSLGVAPVLMGGDSDGDSPVLEHDDVLLIRHLRLRAKRHKSSAGSTSGLSNGSAGGRLHAQPASP